MKVLFIFLELRLSKKVIKRDIRLLLWNQSQNESWKSFSFLLNWDFQKRWVKKTTDFSCEFKAQMTCESHFIFLEFCDFQKTSLQRTVRLLSWNQEQNDVLFILLNSDCQKRSVRWTPSSSKVHLKVPSISLFCDFFC